MNYLIETATYLSTGAWISITIFAVTLLFSFPLSMFGVFLFRFSNLLKYVISFYTWFFRGTPLMLQLFFFMYGLPVIGIPVNRMMVAYVAFIINYTAYFIEIIRAGIEAIPSDQEESAMVEGATKIETFRRILIPQALRNQLPVFTNELITLIKDTALVTVIAISDLLRQVKEVVSRDFTISPFILAAIFYLGISFMIVSIMRYIEKKYPVQVI